jgi:hypothetical protein
MNEASITLENAEPYSNHGWERQLATVLENAAMAILIFDADAQLSYVNPAGWKLIDNCELRLGQRLPADSGCASFLHWMHKARLLHTALVGEIVWTNRRAFTMLVVPNEDGENLVLLHEISHSNPSDRARNNLMQGRGRHVLGESKMVRN